MRKMIFAFILLIMTGCSNSPQKKAENLISQYLNENLTDPDSYQNIEIGELEKISWIDLFLKEDLKKVKSKELDIDGWGDRAKEFRENFKAAGSDPDSIIAYSVEHKYRAKNSFGGYVKNHVEYWFDSKIENIIDVIEK